MERDPKHGKPEDNPPCDPREVSLDKSLADTFPASDPLSTDPDPASGGCDDTAA